MPRTRPPVGQPDREAVEAFISALFRHADPDNYISLRAFHDLERHKPPLFIEAIKVGASNLIDRVCERIVQAATHLEPYVFCPPVATFNSDTSATEADVAEGIALSIECDANPVAAKDKLVALLGEPTATVASGGTWINGEAKPEPKLHLHWRLIEPTRTPEGHRQLKQLRELATRLVGADAANVPLVHPMRMPGSWHRKNKDRPILARLKANPEREIDLANALERLQAACPPEPPRERSQYNGQYNGSRDSDARARDALKYIPADDRETWLRMGMALHSTGWGSAFWIWDDWSRTSSKHDERDQEKTWRSFHDRGDGVTIGTLFHEARQHGYEPREQTVSTEHNGQAKAEAPAEGRSKAVLCKASDLEPESIDWAWKNRFAFGKLAVLAGDPGLGKSTVLLEIAALHSIGGTFPCGEGQAQQCETIILTAEDGLRDTVVPRLIAAGADLSKIHFLTGTKVEGAGEDGESLFDLSRDVPALRDALKGNPNIRNLIIDPLTAYLGNAKAKENAEIRRVLAPLVKLIEETNVLCVANTHLNKGAGKALYRVLDSIAFVAVGRIVHLVIPDADNPGNVKLICDKTNIGSKPPGLTYLIQGHEITNKEGEVIATSRISWGTQHINETADEAMGAERDLTATDDAIAFLKIVLKDGPMAVTDIDREAHDACYLREGQSISQSSPFRAARRALGIVTTKRGLTGGWLWALPEDAPPNTAEGAKMT
jgi:hypothetical protein